MKISCLQENLSHGLSLVSRAVATRSTYPLLSNVLMSTDNGRLRLSATNREIGITCWIGAKVEEDGETTVPARTFSDLVNIMPNGPVEMHLTTRTQTLNVKGGAYNNDIKCMDAYEFPILPVHDETPGVELNVADLREMINQVAFAAATDDARPILTGVNVQLVGSEVTFAAADGFRLSVRTANLSTPVAEPISAIIPAKALAELGRMLNDEDTTVTMALPSDGQRVLFWLKDAQLVAQLLPGTFPDYRQLIPKESNTIAIIPTAGLRNACKAADVFAREAANTARFKIVPGAELMPGVIEVRANSNELGSNEVLVDANIEGNEVEIAFNVRYMLEVLNVIDTPNVELRANTATSPGLIRPVGREDFVHVIMPMRL